MNYHSLIMKSMLMLFALLADDKNSSSDESYGEDNENAVVFVNNLVVC